MKGNPPRPSLQNPAQGLSATAARLLSEADTALGRMKLDDAERALFGVLALAPNCAEANRLMGVVSQIRGDHARAIEFLRDALAVNPDDATTHMNLGSALFEAGATEAALVSLRHACELAPRMAAGWYNLGKALKLQFQYEAACVALRHALGIDATHVLSLLCLADAQTGLGDIAEATRNYREVLRRQPTQAQAWFSLANLKTVRFEPADVVHLRRALQQTGATTDARISLGFALAKAYEDQGDYVAAFETLRQANVLKRRSVSWNGTAERNRVDAIMAAFAQPLPAPLDPTLGKEVVFIVSLPRSGTTLTEQILASHPDVEGANEITDLPQVIEDESKRRGKPFPQWVRDATAEDWARLGRDYLARTERWRQERPRFTDKNLVTWQLVGAIMAMLPGAHVVSAHRDPLETCFACYRQLFSNGAYFSYDLTDMASHYRDYDRLSRHWQTMFPPRILDYPYEALLAEPETRIRQLLAFCELGFDEACLAPHLASRTVRSTASAAQVRQPLRAPAMHSARYAHELMPLRAQLQAMGLLASDAA
ncbi:MAG: sulfotransferase [Rhodanobacter sp.]